MGKASERALAELHGAIATSLTECVKIEEIEEEGGKIRKITPSAAHIMAAITFLKNNNITADAESNAELSQLNEALAARRRKSKLNLLDVQKVADQFDREMGYPGDESP